jgi:hypothetical protein
MEDEQDATEDQINAAYESWIDYKVAEVQELIDIIEEWHIDPDNEDYVSIWIDSTDGYEEEYEYRFVDEWLGFYDNDINAKLTDGSYIYLECCEVYLLIPTETARKLGKTILED